VLAPLPVKVAVAPVQITVLLGVMVNVGDVRTETDCTAVLVQALLAVAVRV
jgi:hypothetical protein